MTDTQEAQPQPIAPIADEEYEAAMNLFDDGGSDLDGLCIREELTDIVARGLADLGGEEYFGPDFEDESGLSRYASRAIDALIRAGAIRRNLYSWTEGSKSPVNHVHFDGYIGNMTPIECVPRTFRDEK